MSVTSTISPLLMFVFFNLKQHTCHFIVLHASKWEKTRKKRSKRKIKNNYPLSFGVQDGVALPTTEKTLPFGGEVRFI